MCPCFPLVHIGARPKSLERERRGGRSRGRDPFGGRQIGNRNEAKDAEEDCPAYPEAPERFVPRTVGADRQGKERQAISGDEVCP